MIVYIELNKLMVTYRPASVHACDDENCLYNYKVTAASSHLNPCYSIHT